MNIKKIVTYLVIIMVICYGVGISIISFTGGFKDNFSISYKNKKTYNDLDQEKIEKIDNINQISIETSSCDVNIIPEDREDVKAHLYGNITSTFKPELETKVNGNELLIFIKRPNSYSIFNSDLKLDIFVPKNYKESIDVDSSSSNINIQNELTLNSLSIDLSSGNTKLKDLNIKNLKCEASSGSLIGENIITNNTVLDVSSGTIELNNFTGDLKGDSSSGSIEVNYNVFDNNIDLETSSGTVDIGLPDDAKFYLDAECSSGNIECDFPIVVRGKQENNTLKGTVGDDKNKIIINTSSGNVNIY
ncbi:DUF4097 family beta strand repeat-containing protein [Tepidibacter hydrothermalis]|uniref:DUF4097 family beta strand repeat-containing protein n=1 Tax=Tepidibacter hydrothermalis TaxID=3036126 RepID=A0ABY8EEW9_9FIRM|nr:DUF4097 family beta strand repeat-containing protein [Tepidibacter hydrothermalis]WFD11495.1 DUF4097 family beta strand repeat-containing protein [Tepidibacter hydrothermalis]